jgi:LPXTG-motif cell wall-anchored protein
VIHVFAMIIPTIALPAAGLVLAIGSGIYFRSRRAEADKDLRDLRFR